MSIQLRIAEDLDIDPNWVTRIVARAPHAYKVYSIRKKSGGARIIAQPARETKALQYWLINNIFNNFPIHDAATAYKKGASIVQNAERHRKNAYIAKFDFRDFFTSIKDQDIEQFLGTSKLELSEKDRQNIARLCCISNSQSPKNHLSIGAPSSPIISNILLFNLDNDLALRCKKIGVTYTRYADDITFSSKAKDPLRGIEKVLRDSLRASSKINLRLNNKKTIFLSKKHSRVVTGIVISNDERLSIGREQKRRISATVHRCIQGKLSIEEKQRLQGHLAHAKNIDPRFITSLKNKYGADTILKIEKGE